MTTIPFSATVSTNPEGPVMVLLPAQVSAVHEDMLRVARSIAGEAQVVALWTGDMAAEELARYGVTKVVRARATTDADEEQFAAAVSAGSIHALADALVAAATELNPRLIVAAANPTTTDIAGQASIRLGSSAVVDVVKIDQGPQTLHLTRRVLQGTWITEVEVNYAANVITVQYGAEVVGDGGQAIDVGPRGGQVTEMTVPVPVSDATRAVEIISHHEAAAGDRPLSGAQRVVVAGRGTEGDLRLSRELAEELDAALGATRVVTENGWAPHELQVGQSGVVISPRLYLGLGVSGQIHHTMGIQSSQHIVVVVDDPDAPILEMADFGVVGDIHEVVPQLLSELRGEN